MKVMDVTENTIDLVVDFLDDVPSIEKPDVEVVKNASYVTDEDGVCGVLSFEKFEVHALIRYFVFKKTIDNSVVLSLFLNIVAKAKSKGVERIFAIINKKDVQELFELLGFCEFDKELIFINEESFSDGIYKESTVMMFIIK